MPPRTETTEAADTRDTLGGEPPIIVTQTVGPGKQKNNALLYAAGDVITWVAAQNTAGPVTGFEGIDTLVGWYCCGWMDTSGYIFKLDETVKDIPAAGVLTPIRTILTGGSKTVQGTFLEFLNPYVRSLYDDVPIFPVTSSPLKASTTAPFQASYTIPDPPADNRYAFIWDTIDGNKAMRMYAPNCKVTARGNDQPQQADVESADITVTMYPGNVAGSVYVAKRWINYGQDMTGYFT